MSYQVLARKWRPSTFAELVGQSHVLKALVNALEQQRLHHAYLFTGTRGVGKTTIARLLAKSLNCEEGVSSTPCGVCSSCREIAEGRFVDLIEVDAASRTRVEDTRELLENVQYAPTRGRYKVYLIDEVHMLSVSSFNALLKTLEEPPPHVKFLLATTDPHKLPVTVLSRCLQFNLKNMTREGIVGYLNHILQQEQIPFEEAALWLLAEAANGSMRDALSLTDQAIAFGEGRLVETDVASMLGTVDLKRVLNLVRGLIEKDAVQLLAQVADVAEHAPDYRALMNELLSTLHRVAIAQAAPEALDNSKGDREAIQALAQAGQPEDIHLFYQVGTAAVKDMPLAPSERAGFEMALLRMLAFSPSPPRKLAELPTLVSQSASTAPVQGGGQNGQQAESSPSQPQGPETSPAEPLPSGQPDEVTPPEVWAKPEPEQPESTVPLEPEAVAPPVEQAEPMQEQAVQTPAPEPEPLAAGGEVEPVSGPSAAASPEDVATPAEPPRSEDDIPPWEEMLEGSEETLSAGPAEAVDAGLREAELARQDADVQPSESERPESSPDDQAQAAEQAVVDLKADPRWPKTDYQADPKHWWQVTLYQLNLSGMTRTVFAHSQWEGYRQGEVQLLISSNYRKIMNDTHKQRLIEALRAELPDVVSVSFSFGAAEQTPQLWLDQLNHAAWEQAVSELQRDRFVQSLVSDFAAELQTDTVQPVLNPLPTGA